MRYSEAFMLSTNLVKKLKEIYVASAFITILFVYGAVKKSLPTTYISKETYDMAFYVGCANAILLLTPMLKYNMEQIKIAIMIIIRMLVIGTMIEISVRTVLRGESLWYVLVYVLLIIANGLMFKRVAHKEAVRRLVDDAKKRSRR